MCKTFIFKEEILSTKVILVTPLCNIRHQQPSPTSVTNIDVADLISKSDTALFSRDQMWNESNKEMASPSPVESIDGNHFKIISSISG